MLQTTKFYSLPERQVIQFILIFILVYMSVAVTGQITYYWTGDSSSLWADPDNWTPSGVPGTFDRAILDDIGTSDCILTGPIFVNRLEIEPEYSGIFHVGLNSLQIRRYLKVSDSLQFDALDGRLVFSGPVQFDVNGNFATQHLVIDHAGNIVTFGDITITDSLIIKNAGALHGFTALVAKGPIHTLDENFLHSGWGTTAPIVLRGDGDQPISGGGNINKLVIDKPSGEVLLKDDLYINGGQLAGEGVIRNDGGWLIQGGTHFTRYDFMGSVEDFKIDCDAQALFYKDLHVDSNFYLERVEFLRQNGAGGSGHIYVGGDIMVEDQNYLGVGNVSTIVLNGHNQSIGGDGIIHRLHAANSGVVEMLDDLDIGNGGISGILTNGGLSGNADILGAGYVVNILGGANFQSDYEGKIQGLYLNTREYNLSIANDITVKDDLYIDSVGDIVSYQAGNWTISVEGNIITNDKKYSNNGSPWIPDIVLIGDQDQDISGTGRLHDLSYNKTGGILNLQLSNKTFQLIKLISGFWQIDDALACSAFVMEGGLLKGSGSIHGTFQQNGGIFSPGSELGCFYLDGTASFGSNATLRLQVGGSGNCTSYDQFICSGFVGLNNTKLEIELLATPSHEITIFDKLDATSVSGIFNGIPNNSIIDGGGTDFIINYYGGDGNDITLTGPDCSDHDYNGVCDANDRALDFDGFDDFVNINNPLQGVDVFTIEMLVKTNVYPNQDIFMYMWDANAGRFELRMDQGNLTFVMDNPIHHYYTNYTVPIGEYIHVAFSKEGSNCKLFVDGNEVFSVSHAQSMGTLLRLGRWFSSTAFSFNGSIDDLRLWNYVKDQTEILSDLHCEISGNEPGLLGYWDFNQGLAGENNQNQISVYDRTSNGNNGDLYNFSLMGGSSNWIGSEAHDCDEDGIPDLLDNCPFNANSNQQDNDDDGVGNKCDLCPGADDFVDSDADGVPDCVDKCPVLYNPGQEDGDSDSVGDDCDNCPDKTNTNQQDNDSDGIGNRCDNCINDYNPDQSDSDGDGKGDVCDPHPLQPTDAVVFNRKSNAPTIEGRLLIYPNPASDNLTIAHEIPIREISVFTTAGRLNTTFNVDSHRCNFSVAHLNPGIYFLHVSLNTGEIEKRKFVVIR